MTSNYSTIITPTSSSSHHPRPSYPLKKSFLTRFFNVLHYSTVALLVGSSVFLVVNVVGAAKAKKKSFREEQALGKEAAIKAKAAEHEHEQEQESQ